MVKQKLVLVADDSADDFLVIQKGCSKAGLPHKLVHIADGQAVLAYLESARAPGNAEHPPFPDLLILDAKMPGTNGFEVLAFLREHPTLQVPVVMLSGSILRKDKEKALALGASDYFSKPFELAELRELVQTIQDRWLAEP